MLHLIKTVRYITICLLCLTAGIATATPLTRTDEPFQRQLGNIAESSTYAPLASIPCTDGMADEYPCENVDLMAFMPFTEMGITNTVGVRSADIWGWTDPQTNDEYALLSMTIGTSFIRITDPENPVALGLLPTHTDPSNWRDVKVYEDHAFIVAEAGFHGLQVFDLTQLRDITTTTSISPTTIFTHTAHFDSFGSAHNIAINEESGFAYVVGAGTTIGTRSVCDGGLHFINISDPANPINSGCFTEDGYTHDVQCVIYNGPDPDHSGKEVCFASNEDTLTIVDVTDKSTPIMLSRTGYDNAQYTHQGWLTEDHAYFLMNDELDEQDIGVPTETYFWDVSDLDAPFIDNIYSKGIPSIDHNLYTRNDSAFLSNYTSGLRILGISDPTNPVEIGYFDVHPDDNNPNFQGTWSNYPYFESGNVIISSIERGLFVVRPESFTITTPELISSCDASPVTADVRVHAFLDANNPITLSTEGDATTTFNIDTPLPGDASVATFTSDGSNDVDVVIRGTDGTNTDGTNMVERTITLIQSAPNATTLLSPAPQTVNVSELMLFSWSAVRTASSYQLEISTDPGFNTIIYESAVAGTSHEVADLPQNAYLYWRVSAINDCGETPSAGQPFAALPTAVVCANVYEENFENGEDGWETFAVLEDSTDTWALDAMGAYSSTAGWSVNDLPFSAQALTSPIITFTAGTTDTTNIESITLRYWEQRKLTPTDDIALFTFGAGGNIFPVSDALFSEPFDTESSSWNLGDGAVEGWSGTRDWTEMTADFTQFAGGTARLNYILLPGSAEASTQPVWSIDDVSIEVCENVPRPVDFNSGALSYGLAWHGGEGEQRLGSNWDSESTPASGTAPTASDIELTEMRVNEVNEIMIEATQDGWVRGWFDWNGDGVYTFDELVIDQAVVSGATIVTVTPPANTVAGDVAYRLRLSTDSTMPAWGARGYVPNGEVEDGTVNILSLPTAVTLTQMLNPVSFPMLIIVALLLAGVSVAIVNGEWRIVNGE